MKIKNLMSDGAAYYKQKKYDDALLCFTDLLALDPGNRRAQYFMKKLREYYLQEVKIDNIITDYEQRDEATGNIPQPKRRGGKAPDSSQVLSAAERMLDGKTEEYSCAASMLDDAEMGKIIAEKRIATLMDDGQVALRAREIVEEKRASQEKAKSVTLGGGDEIVVIVDDHPELTGRVLVNSSGEIVLPLVNEPVNVLDMTEEEAAAEITEVLKQYIADPIVRVVVSQYASKMFYVIDDISCTPYPITRPDMTLRDALFVADWGDQKALGRVIVMKPSRTKPIIKKVDAFDLLYRGNLAHNMRIESGDVIYVPLTIAAKVSKTIADTLRPFTQIKLARDEWINLKYHRKGYREWMRLAPTGEEQKEQEVFAGSSGSN